jgi:hypothetical protein
MPVTEAPLSVVTWTGMSTREESTRKMAWLAAAGADTAGRPLGTISTGRSEDVWKAKAPAQNGTSRVILAATDTPGTITRFYLSATPDAWPFGKPGA